MELENELGLALLRLFGRQQIVSRGKLRLLHKLAGPHKLTPRRFTVDFFGHRYSGDITSWIDWNVYFLGAYEREYLMLLRHLASTLRACGRGVHYVDVGANVGHHVLFMSTPADRITAFEPFPRVADEIRAKIAENGLSNVQLYPLALGDADGELEMRLDGDVNLGSGSLVADRSIADRSRSVGKVAVRQGARFFEANGIAKIDILKVDVEGFEAAVFRGLRDRIFSDRPIILSEISGHDYSGFGSARAFEAALYPDHTLFSVQARRTGYRLLPFHLPSQEVLCMPNELLPMLHN